MLNLATVIIGTSADKPTYGNQDTWGGQCNNDKQQSPIDLSTAQNLTLFEKKIEFALPEPSNDAMMQRFVYTAGGSDAVATMSSSDFTSSQVDKMKLKIGEEDLDFVDLHIHVGSSEHKLAEDVAAGREIVGEVHAVFEDSNGKKHIYTTILDQKIATSDKQNLRVSTSKNKTKICGESNEDIKRDVLLNKILKPTTNQEYFVYKGSATTPECEEDYTFYIQDTPKDIDKMDFEECKTAADAHFNQGSNPAGNYRKIQKLLDGTEVFTTKQTNNDPKDSSPAALMVTVAGAAIALLL